MREMIKRRRQLPRDNRSIGLVHERKTREGGQDQHDRKTNHNQQCTEDDLLRFAFHVGLKG